MKRIPVSILLPVLVVGFTLLSLPSEARVRVNADNYSQSAVHEVPGATYMYGLGLSTVNVTPFTAVPGFGNSTSITGIYNLTRHDMVQVFFSIPQTSPFNMGVMGLYKKTVLESQYGGIHLGGGLGLGVFNTGLSAEFAMNLSVIAGLHFQLPSLPQIEAHLDGGPTFYIVNTSPRSTTNFQVAALSPALGLSVLYRF